MCWRLATFYYYDFRVVIVSTESEDSNYSRVPKSGEGLLYILAYKYSNGSSLLNGAYAQVSVHKIEAKIPYFQNILYSQLSSYYMSIMHKPVCLLS